MEKKIDHHLLKTGGHVDKSKMYLFFLNRGTIQKNNYTQAFYKKTEKIVIFYFMVKN